MQELLEANGIKLDSYEPGQHSTTCPQCSHKRVKKKLKCLGVLIDADGKSACWNCLHCGWSGPKKDSGKQREPEITYDYPDDDGNLKFQKVRNPAGSTARFYCRQPDGNGRWINNLKGLDHKPLYRWPEIRKAMKEGREIAIVEGEKDADSLWALDIPATCNFDGAADVTKNPKAKPKWKAEYSEYLRGARLLVFNDNDHQGYAHADAVCRMSLDLASRVRRLDLAPHWPDIPKGGDVSDWITLGHGREELERLIAAAPDYRPQTGEQASWESSAAGGAGNGTDDDDEIEKLARLAPLDYERARKAAGERLGVSRLSLLDALVKAKRAELGLDGDDGKQGHAIEFPEPESWPQPVKGGELLNDIAAAVRRHVVLADHARDACALWCAHTFLLERMMITPRLAIRSPVKGCGKTTLLDVVGQLVFRPLPAANCSASSIFRVVEGHRPTLLIDEADSFLANAEELRGVLNSGHRRGGAVLRNVGDDHEPRSFSTYAACAIALIGQLPGTLADRSVTVDLVRRKADEHVEPFRFDRVEHLVQLSRKLVRWTKDNAEAIAAIDPTMPAGLYNRAADNWRGLLAIATIAGGDWLSRGHRAALQGANLDIDESSRLELLLGDIRDVFGGLAAEVTTRDKDRISSAHLIEKLCEIVPRPWGEYGKSGKPLSQNKLARLLKPVGVVPQVVRIGAETPSGYYRHQFEEAWERFLSPKGGFKPQQLNKPDAMGTSASFQSSTSQPDVEVRKSQKSNNDGLCLGVEVWEGDLREQAHASDGNGLAAAGLSQRAISDLAEDYTERAYANAQETGGDTRTAELDADLRRRLAEMVLPEFVETEFGRVMAQVFRV